MKTSFRIDHVFLRLILGRRWREKVWASKADINRLQAQLTASTTPFLRDMDGVKRIKLTLDTTNPVFNPSFIKLPQGYLVALRSPIDNVFNDRFSLRNPDTPNDVNYLVWLDENFHVTKQEILDESIFTEDTSVWTPPVEDIRLFNWDGEVWGSAAIFDRAAAKVEQAIFKLNNNKITQYQVFSSPTNQKVEKNWIPVPFNDVLKIIYSFEPLQILTLSAPLHSMDAAEIEDKATAVSNHPYRGGSQLLSYASGYLALVHSAPIEYLGARLYTHHFVFFNKELQLVEIGRPFFLEHQGIEFVAGIAAHGDGILISYAVGDRVVRLMEIPRSVIDCFLSFD